MPGVMPLRDSTRPRQRWLRAAAPMLPAAPAAPRPHSPPPPWPAAVPAILAIANRSADKALRLAENLRHQPGAAHTVVSGHGYGDLAGHHFDLVINATSSSLQGEVPPLPAGIFAPESLAYDMMYGSDPTPFLVFAQARGVARVADGLGMLVEQAAESFFLWRGVRPRTAPVIQLLRGR